MNVEEYRLYCLSFKGANESTPFGEDHLVIKVLDKMFVLFDIGLFTGINLKCDPAKAIEWREKYDFVLPGYHMNKKHWNTIQEPISVFDKLLKEMTEHSYQMVLAKMSKKEILLLSSQ